MFIRLLAAGALLVAAKPTNADRIHLPDGAEVRGRILTEKPDQLIVDLGYTALAVPRTAIVRIEPESEASPNPAPSASPPLATVDKGFYRETATGTTERSVRELVARIGAAVVQVRTPGGLGSGFFINEEGYLITNFHVIEGETQISIEVYENRNGQLDRKNYKQVRIVAMNKFADLALLKVEDKDAPRFAWVPLARPDYLSVGDRVFAIGSPLGLERTVTEGIVSTKTRQLMGEVYMQTTTQINPGNSGGPLFNLRGEVAGITNMKLAFGEGLGFAIPVEIVRSFLDHRDAFAYDNDNPSNAYRYLEPPRRQLEAPRGTPTAGNIPPTPADP